MMLAFFALICATLALSLLTISTNMSAANRIILNTPKSIFEVSIPLAINDEDFVPYFDKDKLLIGLTSYYDSNLSKYVKNYSLDIYYYNQSDRSYCVSDLCRAVEVNVNANLNFNINMERSIFYEIMEGRYGN